MVLRLENVHKSYASGFCMRRRPVLRGLELGLEPGDAYGLLGGNGAGKSTTLRILLGLTRPDRGTGTLFGLPLGDRAARRRLGYLPEMPTFHDQLTSLEFLRYCGELQGLGGAALRARGLECLERLELGAARDLRLRKMSKGMLQRLGLAQALLGEPELLVLDEPMSGLDPHGRKLVRDLVLEQRAAGRTVLFSTHILSDVEVVCTRAGILRDGRLERDLRLENLGHLTSHVEVQASGLDATAVDRLASRASGVVRSGATVMFTVPPGPAAQGLVGEVQRAGGSVESVVPRRPSLEEIFVTSTLPAAEQAQESAGPAPAAGRRAPAIVSVGR